MTSILIARATGLGAVFLRATLLVTGASCVQGEEDLCGTKANPKVLSIVERTPDFGASVPNRSIVHSFTVETGRAPVNYWSLSLNPFSPAHTAGEAKPAGRALDWVATGSEGWKWTLTPLSWSTAPGHVEVGSASAWHLGEECYFTLPGPIFSYDIAP